MNRKRSSTQKNSSFLFILVIIAIAIAVVFFLQTHAKKDTSSDFVSHHEEVSNEKVLETQSSVDDFVFSFPIDFEIPISTEKISVADQQILEYEDFTLCYAEPYEQIAWAAYDLSTDELIKNVSRRDNFRSDPNVLTGSAELSDYKGSGYDRGHMVPAGDMVLTKQRMDESFFLSNMSPQVAGLNRGLWKDLESQVRNWAKEYERVYIITGPILEKAVYPTIGKNQVAVPEFYYKALAIATKDGQIFMLAFIMPNQKLTGTIWDYQVSVDTVEERTKLDFFSLLPDNIEDKLEAELYSKYPFNKTQESVK